MLPILCCASLAAQQKTAVVANRRHVDSRNTYYRAIALVPYVGKGTPDDPKRPKYAPLLTLAPSTAPAAVPKAAAPTAPPVAAPPRTGIIAFTHLPSDDGKMAVVEFVSADRASLTPILSDKTVVSFEEGQHVSTEIETAVQKIRKDFTLAKFRIPVL